VAWIVMGCPSPRYLVKSFSVEDTVQDIVGFSIQEISDRVIKITGYHPAGLIYPYELQEQIKDDVLVVKIYARCPILFPWQWRLYSKGKNPSRFEYFIKIPENLKYVRLTDCGRFLWIKNQMDYPGKVLKFSELEDMNISQVNIFSFEIKARIKMNNYKFEKFTYEIKGKTLKLQFYCLPENYFGRCANKDFVDVFLEKDLIEQSFNEIVYENHVLWSQ
jgi:hypothetical protein